MDGTKLNRRQLRITKRRLRDIIKEEKSKLIAEQASMDPKAASAIQMLQTAYANLEDLTYNVDQGAAQEINKQLMLIEDAIHALGGVI